VRIQITGSRDFTNDLTIARALGYVLGFTQEPFSKFIVVHGGARGADRLAGEVARSLNMTVEVHRADWKKYGSKAGPMRNRVMLGLKPDVCLAFFKEGAKNIGTSDMVRICKERGIPVHEYWEEA
jgi:hypothetical protein